ncbi:CBF/Mak21 family-domain-containing protein [Lipomyces japonicus]|uniref:CBF/Mak21 family-domain-containing protein n=1 Tax=Lipomyces japonicus TaxID=56871 RepID=UPI0034CD7B2B
MPGVISTKKRVRNSSSSVSSAQPGGSRIKSKLAKKSSSQQASEHGLTTTTTATTPAERIGELERQVTSSTEHYNNLVYLIKYLDDKTNDEQVRILAAAALFRLFAKFLASGLLIISKTSSNPAQETLAVWLRDRLHDFKTGLLELVNAGLNDEDDEIKSEETAVAGLTILMRLVKDESIWLAPSKGEYYFAKSFLEQVITLLLRQRDDDLVIEFVSKYVNAYDDVRYYFYHLLPGIIATVTKQQKGNAKFTTNVLSALYAVEQQAEVNYEPASFWVPCHNTKRQAVGKTSAHRAAFQDAWLAVLNNRILRLSPDQYKYVLQIMHKKIVPFMSKPQSLMDFLTDSYNAGGVISLLSLNALFVLMHKHNLDYPNFYQKLYALLDRNLMHVRYRSRFFRLLDLFLSSTHLSANIVASFIKRLSRLALTSPPSAIVIIIPFIYNLLKRHNTCNHMIHRVEFDAGQFANGNDPFDPAEPDPNMTRALESSSWELQALQQHFHPNVATLAKIMSEPFNKPSYNLEDFLDHSFATMLDAEFSKSVRKPPAIEHDVPAVMFANDDDDDDDDQAAYVTGWQF